MRLFVALASASLALTGTAFAQTGGIAVGAQVIDTSNNPVGTITAVTGDVVTVKTDKVEANLGKASFAQQDGKLYLGMTRAELNAAVEKSNAEAEASLAVGKPVKGSAGTEVGTIAAIDADAVTIRLQSGKSIRVPRAAVAGAPTGAVISATAADIEAQTGAN